MFEPLRKPSATISDGIHIHIIVCKSLNKQMLDRCLVNGKLGVMDLQAYLNQQERGTATQLASELGVSISYLSQMASGIAAISPTRCVQIEKATHGQVHRRDLRPNDWIHIWPELTKVGAGVTAAN